MSVPPPPSLAAGSSAEVQANAFGDDPRIYFSKTLNTWRFEQDDGPELEFDTTKGAWVAVLDDLIIQQQAAYALAGVDENVPAAPVLKRENKKRKVVDYTSATPSGEGTSTKLRKTENVERKSKNTAVYVTGLPPDTEQEDIVERFSKCGVIEEDEGGDPKIKLYAKEDGSFSGDALVVFFKEDSVTLAVNLLDEAEFRLGQPHTVMSVSKADFAHKNHSGGAGAGGGGGEHQPRKTVDKKKITKRIGKMQKKLDEWGDDDGFGPMPDATDNMNFAGKNSRVVVLKHMFSIGDLEEDARLMLDLKEDVREECSTLGEVTNVVLYDKEPEGIITVKFRDPLSAQACVLKMDGRYFDKRRVEAELFTGRQRFKRSGAGDDIEDGGDEAERKRLDDFAKWLMTEGD